MTSLVLGVAGAFVGSLFGSPQIGFAIGSALGRMVQGSESGPSQTIEGPRLSDTQVMNSTYGIDIPRVFNSSRLAGNVIWSSKIKETQHSESHTQSSSGGGGKGGGSSGGETTTTTITYTYAQDLAIAICRGPITAVKRIWANSKLIYDQGTGTCTFTVHYGDEAQVADSYIQSFVGAADTPAYRGIAYVVFPDHQLAPYGNATPNFEFEVETATQTLGGIVGTLCQEAGLQPSQYDVTALPDTVLGYKISNRGTTRQFIEPLTTAFFFDAVESDNKIKFVKRGAPVVAATIPQDDLDAHEYGSAAGDLLSASRKMELELTQELIILYPDKDKFYAQNQQYERRLTTLSRLQRKIELAVVLQASSALTIAIAQLHAEWVARTTYKLVVGKKYTTLEPTDVVDVVKNGIHFPMRLVTKNESKPGIIEFEAAAEDSGLWSYSAPTSLNIPSVQPFFGNNPGNIRAPIIVDAPETDSPTGCELLIAACGLNVDWGGCRVWVSLDNVNFSPVGTIRGASFMGVTTAALPLVADPDLTSTLGVDLSNSLGVLTSVPQVSSDMGVSLCYLDGEMITYKTATLTAANKYNLSTLHRGVYTTPVTAHDSGVPFLVVDARVFRYVYLPDMVGRTVYLKFTSFNTYLLAEQDATAVSTYSYTLVGPKIQAISTFALASPWEGKDLKLKWGDVTGATSFTMVVKSGTTTLRTVAGLKGRDFTYTFEDMMSDTSGVPVRSLTVILTAIGLSIGQQTSTLNVSNTQMPVPSAISILGGVGCFVANFGTPSQTDYSGFLLKYSTISGFAPASAGTVGYQGPGTSAAVFGLTPGAVYYVRIKAYDVFESATATWSSEFSVTTTSAGGVVTLTSIPLNPAAIGGALAFFYDTATAALRGMWGWDGTAWKNTRDGANLVANSVTAAQISVTQLSSIAADMGSITAGNITLDAAGHIKSLGMTGWGTGNGIWAGYNGGAYKLQVGNVAGEYLIWNGSQMYLNSAQLYVGGGVAIFAGTLQVASAASGARTTITNSVIKVFDAGNVVRVKIGDLAA